MIDITKHQLYYYFDGDAIRFYFKTLDVELHACLNIMDTDYPLNCTDEWNPSRLMVGNSHCAICDDERILHVNYERFQLFHCEKHYKLEHQSQLKSRICLQLGIDTSIYYTKEGHIQIYKLYSDYLCVSIGDNAFLYEIEQKWWKIRDSRTKSVIHEKLLLIRELVESDVTKYVLGIWISHNKQTTYQFKV
jgi:hypothetical protein